MMQGEAADSYEWLKDVEMEDVEDAKEGAPPETQTLGLEVLRIRQTLEIRPEVDGYRTSRNLA